MSLETLVEMSLGLAGIYVAAGLIAAAVLHLGGLRRIDPGVEGSGVGFGLLVTPGIVALWPFLLRRWRLAARGTPIYGQADRPRSSAGLRALHRRLAVGVFVVITPLAVIGLLARPAARRTSSCCLVNSVMAILIAPGRIPVSSIPFFISSIM